MLCEDEDFKNTRIYWHRRCFADGRCISIPSTDGQLQGDGDRPDLSFFVGNVELCRCAVEIKMQDRNGMSTDATFVVRCTPDCLKEERIAVGKRFAWCGEIFVFRVAAGHAGWTNNFVNLRGNDEDYTEVVLAAGMQYMRNLWAQAHGLRVLEIDGDDSTVQDVYAAEIVVDSDVTVVEDM